MRLTTALDLPARCLPVQAFLRPGAPLQPGLLQGLPPGAQLSLPDAVRLRDRATILARQLHATSDGTGAAMADQQVAALLQSLAIDPGTLPAELPHQAAPAEWAALWEGQAARGRPPEPLVGAEVAAAHAHAAAAHAAAVGAGAGPAAWDSIWQQQQQQMQGPASTGWADEFAVQRQQQATAAGPGAWAEEFQQQEGGAASDWVQGFTEEQEAAAGTRHGSSAATSADAQVTSARLVAALTADGDPKMKNSKFLQFLSKMSKGELMFEDNKVCGAACCCCWWWCWLVMVVVGHLAACNHGAGCCACACSARGRAEMECCLCHTSYG